MGVKRLGVSSPHARTKTVMVYVIFGVRVTTLRKPCLKLLDFYSDPNYPRKPCLKLLDFYSDPNYPPQLLSPRQPSESEGYRVKDRVSRQSFIHRDEAIQ